MKSRAISLFLLICLAFSSLVSCTQKNDNADTSVFYSFTDSTGNEVTLAKKPEKVAVLFSSYAEIWTLSGGKVSVTVGESVERGFADNSAVLVDSGAGHSQIDLETLVSQKPDLVIGSSDYECQLSAVKRCAELGIPSAAFKVETLDDYLKVLKIMCDINENIAAYEKYGATVESNARSIIERFVSDNSDRTIKILFIRAGSSSRSTKAKNADNNFVCAMLKELGTVNIADTESPLLDSLSLEYILKSQPDYIFISTMGNENAACEYVSSLFESDTWRELTAVQNGAYAFLPKDMFHYKPNARWDTAYSYLIDLLETEFTSEN